MYNEGLIEQSNYIINWDPKLQTAISDVEVEHKEVKGAYYHIKYQIKGDTDDFLDRGHYPAGDTARRYCGGRSPGRRAAFNKYIGKQAIVPLCNREVSYYRRSLCRSGKGNRMSQGNPRPRLSTILIWEKDIGLEIINILNKDGTLNEYGLRMARMFGTPLRPERWYR